MNTEKYDPTDIALGKKDGINNIYKYGENSAVGATEYPIWDKGTAYYWHPFGDAAIKMQVVSSDAADSGIGAGILTLSANVANGDTIVVGSKIYTFQTVLTDVDGNVLIGALATDSIDNLIAAINLGAGAGTLYATSMTANDATTSAAAGAGDTMDLESNYAGEVATTSDIIQSTGVLTLSANVSNNDTVTIGSKTYTFQTVLTNVDGNVKIGASASDSIDNLIAAVNLGAGSGTVYAASMTANDDLSTAAAGAGDTMDLVIDGVGEISTTSASIRALGVLTLSTNVSNNDTVTIGSKIYTFQTTLTNVDGNVKIGASASDSIDNLIAAINLGAGAGTIYATLMTANDEITTASQGAGDTMDLAVINAGSIASTSTSSATGVLTLAANVTDGDTITIGTKVYTFVDELTQSGGDVKIGASASVSIDNLIAAINMISGGAGTIYGFNLLPPNDEIVASQGAGDTMDLVVVDAGAIATTETSATASWGAANAVLGTVAAIWGAATTAVISAVQTWGAATTAFISKVATWGATIVAKGLGAWTVHLFGLDEDWIFQEEIIVLNGTTAVETVNTWRRCWRANIPSGADINGADGNITIHKTGSATDIFAYIKIGDNQTHMVIYTVPADCVLLIDNADANIGKGQDATLKLNIRENITGNEVKLVKATRHLYQNSFTRGYKTPRYIKGKTDVWMSGISTVGSNLSSASFEGRLFDKVKNNLT